jgi:hypothetical protein
MNVDVSALCNEFAAAGRAICSRFWEWKYPAFAAFTPSHFASKQTSPTAAANGTQAAKHALP